jgi:hypothetical protein
LYETITGTLSIDTTGLATEAKQDTGNTSLDSIDTNVALLKANSGGVYNHDAAGRNRVSQVTTLGDYKHHFGVNALLMDSELIGTATAAYDATKSHIRMTTSANADAAIHQTKQWHNYQAGKSHNPEMTFTNFAVETNIIKRVGYFSSNIVTPFDSNKDGFYIESDGVTDNEVKIVVTNNGTVTAEILQSAWDNPIASYDWDKFTVTEWDFLWLGGTAFRLFVVINGVKELVHTYLHAGIGSGVAILSPNQPIRYEIRQVGAGSGTLDMICAQVSSEGAINQLGITGTINTNSNFVNANAIGTSYAIVGLRLQAAKRGVEITVKSISINSISSNKNYIWRLLLNPTVAGTFTYANKTNYNIQQAIGDVSGSPSTNTVTGGTELAVGYADSASPVNDVVFTALRLGSKVDGTLDEYVLAVTPQTTNQDVSGGIGFLEFL